MARRAAKKPDVRARQLLLRVTEREYDVLKAAGHLHDVTPNAYAYGLLRTHVASLAEDPFVLADIENRRRFDAAWTNRSIHHLRQPPIESSDGVNDDETDRRSPQSEDLRG